MIGVPLVVASSGFPREEDFQLDPQSGYFPRTRGLKRCAAHRGTLGEHSPSEISSGHCPFPSGYVITAPEYRRAPPFYPHPFFFIGHHPTPKA